MATIKNFLENDDTQVLDELGALQVVEWERDLSVNSVTALTEYFSSKMHVRSRQLLCDLSQSPITVQAGAMQYTVGDVSMTTGVKSTGDFLTKAFRGAASGESIIKPEYTGTGTLVLEPTRKHILLIDVNDFDNNIVLDDGLFLACYSSLKQTTVARSNVSSAVFGREGLFNLGLSGYGAVAIESPVPREELITIELNNDCLKVDGNNAIAWSGSLQFSTERSGRSLIGSAASGEGLVNVYRGTGKVLMAPVTGYNVVEANSAEASGDSTLDNVADVADALSDIVDLFN